MSKAQASIGVELGHVSDLSDALDHARHDGFDFVLYTLAHPRFQRSFVESNALSGEPWTRSDLVLHSQQWGSMVVAMTSPWIDVDCGSPSVRAKHALALQQELTWAAHLSVPAVVLPAPRLACHGYARIVNEVLVRSQYMRFWVRVPLQSDDASWAAWNRLRSLCGQHASLHIALQMGSELPPSECQARWLGEPVKAVLLPTRVFSFNRKGFPTLPAAHQRFVAQLHLQKAQFVICGRALHSDGLRPYQMYLNHLISKIPEPTEMQSFEAPYLDYLQAPLQPLMDNLESQTYETFERDPIKYARYEEAIYRALLDAPAERAVTVLMVVGAGRGPLVRAALNASRKAERKLRVYAVEKNPNAVVTLRNMKISRGWRDDEVTIVHCDMRDWKAPELADILVSELLGSWGDNELSPECLDGAQQFLKPSTGISIPYEYTSYVAPVTSSKLWNEVNAYGDYKKFETAYVVKLHNFAELAEPAPVFTFGHPNYEQPIDNKRCATLAFAPLRCAGAVLHGFAGYFEAKLYADVLISINPPTFSEGMFSWFPMYIPIRTPVTVAKGDVIEACFWRQVSPKKVWYEWSAGVAGSFGQIHNANGRSHYVGL